MKKTSTERKSKTSTKRTGNREFVIITYLFVAVFIMLMGYFVYFQVFKRFEYYWQLLFIWYLDNLKKKDIIELPKAS